MFTLNSFSLNNKVENVIATTLKCVTHMYQSCTAVLIFP